MIEISQLIYCSAADGNWFNQSKLWRVWRQFRAKRVYFLEVQEDIAHGEIISGIPSCRVANLIQGVSFLKYVHTEGRKKTKKVIKGCYVGIFGLFWIYKNEALSRWLQKLLKRLCIRVERWIFFWYCYSKNTPPSGRKEERWRVLDYFSVTVCIHSTFQQFWKMPISQKCSKNNSTMREDQKSIFLNNLMYTIRLENLLVKRGLTISQSIWLWSTYYKQQHIQQLRGCLLGH